MNIGASTIKLPGHSYTYLGNQAFGSLTRCSNLTIGSAEDICDWDTMLSNSVISSGSQLFTSFGSLTGTKKVYLYSNTIHSQSDELFECLGFPVIELHNALQE